jgi:WD40 repeat protein
LVTLHGDQPVPKVIDFGIAKSTQQRLTEKTLFTQFQHFIGTPAYMSPEQASLSGLDIDTRSDIYALGVLLYELLTGKTPFDSKALLDAGYEEIRRIIREVEPPKPSTRLSTMRGQELSTAARQRRADPKRLGLLIRGDLDWIVMKALEKDRTRRYETANGLAADARRFLQHEPVTAAAPSPKYRLQKFVQRNRMAVIGSATILALLVSGITVTTWLAVVASRARDIANVARNNESKANQRLRKEQAHLSATLGNKLEDEGDFLGALPFFLEALVLEQGMPLDEEDARLRIGSLLEQCPKLTQLLVLDGQVLESADLSPDGLSVMTASRDGVATLCDLNKGTKRQLWQTNRELYATSFSPNGKYSAIGGEGFVQVWETDTDKPVCSVTPIGYVDSIKFTFDGSQFVVASGNERGGHIYLYDTRQPWRGTELTNGPAVYRWAALSRDGTRLVTGSEDGIAQVWEFETMRPIGDSIKHSSWVVCAAFNSDGSRVATASSDGKVKVSDAVSGKLIHSLSHPAGVRSVKFSPDDRFIVTACWDRTVRIWDVSTGELTYPILRHGGKYPVWAAFSSEGHCVLTVNANGVICRWDFAKSKLSNRGQGYLLASKNGQRLFAVETNHIEVLDPANRGTVANITAKDVREVVTSDNGQRLITFSQSFESSNVTTIAQLWDTTLGKVASAGFSLKSATTKGFLDSRGERLITWEPRGKQAILWDTINGVALHSLNHGDEVSGGCFSPDGTWLVTISTTNVYIWKGDNTNPPFYILHHPDDVEHVAFSPDSHLLVTCCGSPSSVAERDAQIWELNSAKKLGPPLHHLDGVLYAEFSPDGKYVVTTSEDATACVWEAPSGKPLFPPLQHEAGASVTEAHFSLIGRWIVTASANKTARVWDAQTGESLTPQLRHDWPFRHAQFVANDQAVFTRRSQLYGGQTMLWQLAIGRRSLEQLTQLAEVLSGNQTYLHGAVRPQRPEELQKAWELLRVRQPTDFIVSTEDIVNWYLHQAEVSDEAKQWSAAAFHWKHLIEADPTNRIYLDHLNRARDNAKRLDSVPGH